MGQTDRTTADGHAASSSLTLALYAIGLGCLLGLGRCVALSPDASAVAGGAPSPALLRSLGAVITLAALAVLAALGRVRVGRTPAIVAGLATGLASLVVPLGTTQAPGAALALAGAAVYGVGGGFLMFVWAQLLARLDVRRVVIVAVCALAMAGAVIGVYAIVSGVAAGVLLAVAALASGALAVAAHPRRDLVVSDGPASLDAARRLPWFTVVMFVATDALGMALFLALSSLYVGGSPVVSTPVFASATVVVIAATLAILLFVPHGTRLVWMPLFALLFAALLASCTASWTLLPVIAGLLYASLFCHHFLRWAIVPAVSAQAGFSRVATCALLLLVTDSGLWSRLAGLAVPASSSAGLQAIGGLAGLMALVLLVLFCAAFAIDRTLRAPATTTSAPAVAASGTTSASASVSAPDAPDAPAAEAVIPAAAGADGRSGADGAQGVPQPQGQAADAMPHPEVEPSPLRPLMRHADTPESRLERIARRHDFTQRELEIARLTAQGNTSNRIADILVISSSTVRFHQQNIYRKLDIHSRQEFIDLINGTDGDGARRA
ncbi:helix-turn-helix transcriptional regulator [bacterium]|nr:helix-turn-helix transcriptional regulator [bacterium]